MRRIWSMTILPVTFFILLLILAELSPIDVPLSRGFVIGVDQLYVYSAACLSEPQARLSPTHGTWPLIHRST